MVTNTVRGVVLYIFIVFREIKLICSCRFIFSEGLLFVLKDCYIMRNTFVTWLMNDHNLRFLILEILLTAPTGYKQVWYLEWVHIINEIKLLIRGYQKFGVYCMKSR